MGNSVALPETEPLSQLCSPNSISGGSFDWDGLCSVKLVPSSSAEELQLASDALCATMATNNPRSGNFQVLVLRVIDLLQQATKPKVSSVQLQQACSCLFLARLFLRHMVETLEPDVLETNLVAADGAPLAGPLVEALLTVLVQCDVTDQSYWLLMEAAAALTVCMSTQMYAGLAEASSQPLVAAALTSGGPGAELLVARLLSHVVRRPPPPPQSVGLLRRLGSAARSVLLLPYNGIAYLLAYQTADSADAEKAMTLAGRSVLLLLLLTQHIPPALLPAVVNPTNPFLEALRDIGDESPFDGGDGAAGDDAEGGGGGAMVDPEQGRLRASRVSFRELHDAIARALPEPSHCLLLYLLLHGNRDYLDYTLSRTDPETLLLPLLKLLHDSRALSINRLYMLLILLLMLSQDAGFITTAQKVTIPHVPWYRERLLGTISLGSLFVVVLVRAVQANLSGAQDAYVHTNCLAALANIAPHLRKLHPHAARCLVSLCDLFSRRYFKLQRRLTRADGGEGTDGGRAEERDDAEGDDATQLTIDFLRIGLEAINLCLASGPALNEHLVYSLLERTSVFDPLRRHQLFGDLIENIDHVLEHFGATLRAQPSAAVADGSLPGGAAPAGGASSDAVWSVEAVLSHIRDAGSSWRAERLQPVADLRFTYEQEPSPEEFFTPYIWSVVYERAAVGWDPSRIVLFQVRPPTADDEAGAAAEGAAVPALSSIDVDVGATGGD